MTTDEIVRQFADAINDHNVPRLFRLMAEKHVFIDSLGETQRGRTLMRKGWTAYFKMVPDYKIELLQVFADGQTVVATGMASGTFTPDGKLLPANHWSVPAAWRAVVESQRVTLWQIYADNEPIRALMRKPPQTL